MFDAKHGLENKRQNGDHPDALPFLERGMEGYNPDVCKIG
jgi:hypothetical protein